MKYLLALVLVTLTTIANAQQNIPELTLNNLQGEKVNVQELSKTEGVKIYAFWATWCVPCINELDAINDVYDEWQEETGVELIAVSTDDTRTKKRIKPLVDGKNWNYTILLDDNQDLKRALNISLIPYTIVVKNGEIIYKHSGYTPGAEDDLYEVVKSNSN